VGIQVQANFCQIELQNYWGDNLANTAIKYGASGINPNGGVINAYVNGCNTGLRLEGLGKGNRILIRHGTSVTNPITFASGVVLAGNQVQSLNVSTGVITTYADDI